MSLWDWINERHAIAHRRRRGDPRPWSDDPLFNDWSFTHVFRELDRGTLALRNLLLTHDGPDMLFNICWYRVLNRTQHAKRLGYVTNIDDFLAYFRNPKNKPMFSAATQTCAGLLGPDVLYGVTLQEMWKNRHRDWLDVAYAKTLAELMPVFMKYDGIGRFLAYEIVTDIRHEIDPFKWTDAQRWASVGPGSAAGLKRLGMDPTPESIYKLWIIAPAELGAHVPMNLFEAREVEHSLCEFDKYERLRLKTGCPRRGPFKPHVDVDFGPPEYYPDGQD